MVANRGASLSSALGESAECRKYSSRVARFERRGHVLKPY